MWVVILGLHFKYLKGEDSRYETRFRIFALVVYCVWHCRYSFSAYPVKYLKIYKKDQKVIDLKSYNKTYQGKFNGN